MFTFLRIERPTTHTFRPVSTATSIACCMRWTFEANDAISTRPCSRGMICRNASPTTRSDGVTPGPLGVRRVAEQQVDAAVPDLGQRARRRCGTRRRACGRSCSRPCGRSRPAGRVEHDRDGVRDRVRHADELEPEGPDPDRAPSGSISISSAARSSPCSSSFDLTSPSVSRVAQTSRDVHLPQQVRQRADVVLVRRG